MIVKQLSSVSVYQFEILTDFPELFHFVMTRNGGVSRDTYSSFNLSSKVTDNPVNIKKNRQILAENLAINVSDFIYPDQCHTDNFKKINTSTVSEDLIETDALISDIPGKVICVSTADCVPILLYAPDKKICAAIHAGWRGLVSRLPVKVIQELIQVSLIDVTSLIACIGPCISVKNYETGQEVISEINKLSYSDGLIKKHTLPEKGLLDLVELTRRQLILSGIHESNIEISGICTFDNSEEFFSARRNGYNTGRFVTGITLRG